MWNCRSWSNLDSTRTGENRGVILGRLVDDVRRQGTTAPLEGDQDQGSCGRPSPPAAQRGRERGRHSGEAALEPVQKILTNESCLIFPLRHQQRNVPTSSITSRCGGRAARTGSARSRVGAEIVGEAGNEWIGPVVEARKPPKLGVLAAPRSASPGTESTGEAPSGPLLPRGRPGVKVLDRRPPPAAAKVVPPGRGSSPLGLRRDAPGSQPSSAVCRGRRLDGERDNSHRFDSMCPITEGCSVG